MPSPVPDSVPKRRTLLRALPALLVTLVALAAVPAKAQVPSKLVPGPIATKRFERLLDLYVGPSVEEASAIDRIHEAYLDRFRAEIDPELKSLEERGSGAFIMVSNDTRERYMREIDRLQARVQEADNAMLAKVGDALPESKRAGLSRVRDARERQRRLAGVVRFAPMMFGIGCEFVDMSDMLGRREVIERVSPELRGAFDAVLRSQEERVLAQARRHQGAAEESLKAYFDGMKALSAEYAAASKDHPGDLGGIQQRMGALRRDTSATVRKTIAANYDANRSACSAFGGMLEEGLILELRSELARRAAGSVPGRFGGGADPRAVGPPVVAARIMRDSAVDAAAKATVSTALRSWREQDARAMEELADAAIDDAGAGIAAMFGGSSAGTQDPVEARIRRAIDGVDEAAQRAFSAFAAAIGDRRDFFLREARPREGSDTPRLAGLAARGLEDAHAEPSSEDAMDSDTTPSSLVDGLDAFPDDGPASVTRVLALFGLSPESRAAAEGVITAWYARDFVPKVIEPCRRERVFDFRAPLTPVDPQQADAAERFEAESRRVRAAQARIMGAMFAADEVLRADLAAALGLDPDGAELLALRLERIALMQPRSFIGDYKALTTPAAVLAAAKSDPAVARAVLVQSAAEWRRFADELPARMARFVANLQDGRELGQRPNTGQEAYDRVYDEELSIACAVLLDTARAIDGAIERSGADDGVRAGLQHARRRLMHPPNFVSADCASAQLAAALAIAGLDDERRTRLDVLRAEYDAVFDELTRRLCDASLEAEPDAKASQQVAAALERLRFARDERTAKARAEARRILGDELAIGIRGLVPADAPSQRSIFAADDEE